MTIPEPHQGPAIVDGLPDTDYHADRGSLSSSGAKMMLAPSTPAHFRHRMDHPPEPRDVFDIGTVAHTLLLGTGSEIAVIEAADWRSKYAREQKEKAREAGRTPILAADYQRALGMRDAVLRHEVAGPLFAEGVAERSLYWTDDETGVRLRARPDWITQIGDRPVIVDFKTTTSVAPRDIEKSITNFGYAVQAAWYIDGFRACGLGEAPGWLFVFAEKPEPHGVVVVELDPEFIAYGAKRAREAIDLYARCVADDQWPGHADTGVLTISKPAWAN